MCFECRFEDTVNSDSREPAANLSRLGPIYMYRPELEDSGVRPLGLTEAVDDRLAGGQNCSFSLSVMLCLANSGGS